VVGQNWEAERLALEMYQKAAVLDPQFALAHAWIARTHLLMVGTGYDLSLPTGVTEPQRFQKARDGANRALAIDPDLPEAHLVLSSFYYYARDTARGREEIDRVLRAAPSDAQAFLDQGNALVRRRQLAEAVRS